MAYIVVMQPAVLSTDLGGRSSGPDSGADLLATCLGSGPTVRSHPRRCPRRVMMMERVRGVKGGDPTEAVPVFLMIAGILFTSSIADGLAPGFVSYPVSKLLAGRGREVCWLSYTMTALLLLYFVMVRHQLG